jgi:hypothetical protein
MGTINRTTLTDDDGSGTTGSILNNAELQSWYDAVEGELIALNNSGHLSFVDATELTIASGVITVTNNFHKVDTQSDASSDDLDTITAGTDVRAGHILLLRVESGSRTVVLKHGTGSPDNLDLGEDITLDETYKTVMLLYDGTNWRTMAKPVPAAVTAAGSDTQVQYNDGGTNFGGDAGLVYNDSTDVLTAGKLATTDTSATSVDFAGGITAGTGNVGIVNTAGKIPALSSTYLADLSGANLTGIGGGKILQAVFANYGTQVTATTTSFVATGLTVNITPASSSNPILIFLAMNGLRKDGSTGVGLRLLRDIASGTANTVLADFEGLGGYDAGSGTQMFGGCALTWRDAAHSSTAALTYHVSQKCTLGTGTTYTNGSNAQSSIVVMEIEA